MKNLTFPTKEELKEYCKNFKNPVNDSFLVLGIVCPHYNNDGLLMLNKQRNDIQLEINLLYNFISYTEDETRNIKMGDKILIEHNLIPLHKEIIKTKKELEILKNFPEILMDKNNDKIYYEYVLYIIKGYNILFTLN